MFIEFGIILFVAVVMASAAIYYNRELNKEKEKISIKESIELTNMPVITLTEGDTKLNFLLDSGSSHSHIAKSVADKLTGTPVDTEYSFTTGTGTGLSSKAMDIVLKYKVKKFDTTVFINKDLDKSFECVKNESGIQLHGILGADFLVKHKYILDFAELVAYHK